MHWGAFECFVISQVLCDYCDPWGWRLVWMFLSIAGDLWQQCWLSDLLLSASVKADRVSIRLEHWIEGIAEEMVIITPSEVQFKSLLVAKRAALSAMKWALQWLVSGTWVKQKSPPQKIVFTLRLTAHSQSQCFRGLRQCDWLLS